MNILANGFGLNREWIKGRENFFTESAIKTEE